MFKYKILKVMLLAGSVVGFCVPLFSEYVREKTVQRYDLRWYEVLNKKNRTQTIVIRNASNQPKANLVLELDFGSAPGVVSDLEVAFTESGPYESFLDAVERTIGETSLSHLTEPELKRTSQALDKHSSVRSLSELDVMFDDILKTRLIGEVGKRMPLDLYSFRFVPQDWHLSWKEKCASPKASADCPKVDSVVGNWEQAKDAFRNAALKNWYERTGVKLDSDSNQLSFGEKLLITLSLAANENRVVRFHYAHGPANIAVSLRSTTGEQTTQLKSPENLFSPFVSVLISQHPILIVVTVILALVLGYFSPLLMPLRLIPIEKIFNFALESKDDEYWKHALERHRFFILQQFRQLRRRFNPALKVDSDEEVLDFVRNVLMVKHDRSDMKFQNTKGLNTSIHDELRHLVLTAV